MLNSSGFAQGSLVPIARADGTTDWHGMFFRDSFPTGRIPGLIPATWKDGWPTFGTNGSVPVGGGFPKPIRLTPEEELFESQKSLVVSDDFDNDAPAKAYQDEEWTIPAAPSIDPALIGVELLQNPGAESGTAPWAGQFGATLTADSTDPASGAAALKVGTRTLNGSGPSQILAAKLQPGVTYTVSAKVKHTSGPASVRFNLCADFGAGPQTMVTAAVPQGQWTTITGRYTVPQNASVSSVKFAVETPWGSPQPASSSVEYLLDDVSMIGAAPTTEQPTAAEIEPNGSRLDPAWQWNHAPDNRYWSLTEREGWLRLTNGKVVTGAYQHTKLSNSPELTWLEEARNTLSQRIVAPKQSAEATLDVSGMKDGDVACLAAYNRGFSYVAVKRVDGVNTVGVVNRGQPFAQTFDQAAVEAFLPGTTAVLPAGAEVHLKADLELNNPAGQLWTTFSYSLDGTTWSRLGDRVGPQTLDGTLTHFMGHRLGLFSYATQTTGGHVDVDEFLLSDTLSSEGKALDRSRLDAAIAHAATLREADYPAEAWSAMRSVLAKAQAVTTAGTQNRLDAPERALSYQLARLGTLKAAALDVTAEATIRCIAGKVVLTVKATNREQVPVAIEMTTASGAKSFAAVAPGRNASHAFTTRATSVPAGEATVTATATVDGAPVSTTVRAPHPAATCG